MVKGTNRPAPAVTRWFHARSLKQKLMILFMATAMAALAVVFLASWIYETGAYRSTVRRESITLAHMLADSGAAAVTFDDAWAGQDAVTTLRAEPRIDTACILKNGVILSIYDRDMDSHGCRMLPGNREYLFGLTRLEVAAPIQVRGEVVGTAYLGVDLTEMWARMGLYAAVGALVTIMAALFAFALSSRLQRIISHPILHLTEVAAQVSEGSYELRAEKTSDDELGTLIQQFNDMLDQIRRRDVQLQRAQDELEMRVQVRTRALKNEIAERTAVERDLVNAKLAAEESNRAKSVFLANMSHELRTPLNAVIGYSELLIEEAPDMGYEPAVKDLGRINWAARHLLSLINDVLDISKIEAGRMEAHLEPTPLAQLISEAAETVAPLAEQNRNRLTVQAGADLGVAMVDAVKFRQSLLNLLSNACKFTHEGEVRLLAERHRESGGDWIRCRVEDSGIGIAPESMSKLFQPFSQVDSSATRKYGGTGLGLAISQRFCQMMGGRITVESKPGHGSAFTIHIPAANAAD
jgi:signal transduction histidine kinase